MSVPAAETLEFAVTGMTCGHCKSAVEKAVAATPGVRAVAVDLDTGKVAVEGGDRTAVIAAIGAEGYEATVLGPG